MTNTLVGFENLKVDLQLIRELKMPNIKEICLALQQANLSRSKDYTFEDLHKLLPADLRTRSKEEFYDAISR